MIDQIKAAYDVWGRSGWIQKLRRHRLLRHTDGQDLIEYALLAGLIAVAVAATFPKTIGPNISTIMSKVYSQLVNARAQS